MGVEGFGRRLDQLWWPSEGLRKRDALAYYAAVAPVLLPHLHDRPFTCKRHYNGPRSPFAWVKDAPEELPARFPRARLPAKSRGGALVHYVLVNDAETLLWLVDFGCIDLHVWTARADRPERPDFVLFDLDPADVAFADVVQTALLVRDALAALGLEAWPMTTGGDGLHVRVPIARRHTHPEARELAGIVADALVHSSGGLVTTERSLADRRGVFLDTKMNGHGQQVVAPYSVRPATARVATPLRWDEVEPGLDPGLFTMAETLRRVESDGDLAAPLLRGAQRLSLEALSSAAAGTHAGR